MKIFETSPESLEARFSVEFSLFRRRILPCPSDTNFPKQNEYTLLQTSGKFRCDGHAGLLAAVFTTLLFVQCLGGQVNFVLCIELEVQAFPCEFSPGGRFQNLGS